MLGRQKRSGEKALRSAASTKPSVALLHTHPLEEGIGVDPPPQPMQDRPQSVKTDQFQRAALAVSMSISAIGA